MKGLVHVKGISDVAECNMSGANRLMKRGTVVGRFLSANSPSGMHERVW